MGNKERIQKELDLFLEKLKFWRYVIFAIVSGVIGVVISIKRIDVLTKEYEELLEILEKEE
ncbi:hypothetical protein [Caminibacter pacificus]